MRRRHCHRNREEEVCSCEMGKIYRFAEPIVLISIAKTGEAHGYTIAQESEKLAVTHSKLDTGVIYRTLHPLEQQGKITSAWDTSGSGPARRMYRLTNDGWIHIEEWAQVIEQLVFSLSNLRNVSKEVLRKDEKEEVRDNAPEEESKSQRRKQASPRRLPFP